MNATKSNMDYRKATTLVDTFDFNNMAISGRIFQHKCKDKATSNSLGYSTEDQKFDFSLHSRC